MLEKLIEQLLKELGQNVHREGLEKTPERVAKALRYLTSGYDKEVKEVLNDAMFVEEYDEMVIVKDIDFFSLCVPSKQIVNAVGGAKPAREVKSAIGSGPSTRAISRRRGSRRSRHARLARSSKSERRVGASA